MGDRRREKMKEANRMGWFIVATLARLAHCSLGVAVYAFIRAGVFG